MPQRARREGRRGGEEKNIVLVQYLVLLVLGTTQIEKGLIRSFDNQNIIIVIFIKKIEGPTHTTKKNKNSILAFCQSTSRNKHFLLRELIINQSIPFFSTSTNNTVLSVGTLVQVVSSPAPRLPPPCRALGLSLLRVPL